MPTAYSYVRFSSPQQAAGDSLRRQTERAADYCRRHGLTLDPTLTLKDLSVSAFHGANAAVGNFRTFLDAVKSGRVTPGSVLVVESWDRISRQGIDEGYDIIKGILKAGVRIATLSPEREFDATATKSLSKGALEIQLILERAAEESETKSKRCGEAWQKKQAGAGSKLVTRKLPGWIRYDEKTKRLELIPANAATVRRIFRLARTEGMYRIARRFNAEGVPVIGRTTHKGKPVVWSVINVAGILNSRSAFGEYQPHRGRGKERVPVGDPIEGYYPAAISKQDFDAARGSMELRKQCRGRRGKAVYLFSGLLRDARDGGTICYKAAERSWGTTLINVGAKNGKGIRGASYPADVFDDKIIEQLQEVTAADLHGESDDGAAKRIDALAGQVAELDALTAKWSEKMDDVNLVDVVSGKLAQFAAKKKILQSELDAAQQEAALPLAESWGEFRKLSELLAADKSDDLRLRVRAALRRAIESVHCLFIGSNRKRVAAVRVEFRGQDRHRDYVIRHKHRNGNGSKPETEVESFAEAGLPDNLDLRRPDHAKRLEMLLVAAEKEIDAAVAELGK
jgi:DNA invertase Pin-like site-specific DNA recombinase